MNSLFPYLNWPLDTTAWSKPRRECNAQKRTLLTVEMH
jgi:hypothetical protein